MRALNLAAVAAALLLSACVDTITRGDVQPLGSKLTKERPVVIAVSQDGSYEDKNYPGSGKAAAMVLREAFAKRLSFVSVAQDCYQLKCMAPYGADARVYYVVPEILHWEDRATEWSAIPDRVEIKISIFDSADSTLVASTIITGKSKTWAWVPGHPQDMLAEPVNAYVRSLY